MNKINDVKPELVAQSLLNKKIVAIFQGRSEAGSRALGNRSMLYTPIDPNGKDHVNIIKGRELFRPLAASILHEHANDWFDMMGIEEAPYMTYSFRAKSDKMHIIPSVIHVDGSCRIQTVKREQNLHYYELINEFYKLSNVPLLLNTSLNLAGDPIVETVDEALETFIKSKIDMIYFPELQMAIEK